MLNADDQIKDEFLDQLLERVYEQDPSLDNVHKAVGNVKRRISVQLASIACNTNPFVRTTASPTKTLLRSKRVRILAIAAVVAFCFSVYHTWKPVDHGAGVVFAQVFENIRNVRTVRYTITEISPSGTEDIVEAQALGSRYIRLTGAKRGIRIIDFLENKFLRYDLPQQGEKKATLYTFIGPAAEALQSVGHVITDFENLRQSSEEDLGSREIDGVAVIGFRLTRVPMGDDLDDHSVWEIWVDPVSALPVQIDIVHVKDRSKVKLGAFQFNVKLEESLFDLQPPIGYEVTHETVENLE